MTAFTHAVWHVKAGHEAEFEAAWKALGAAFMALPHPPGRGTLLRSVDDPRRYVSFGPWPDHASIRAMRADPRAAAALQAIKELCDEARPGAYDQVAG